MNPRFNQNPSPEYTAAVAALKKLPSTTERASAAAESIATDLKSSFAKRLGKLSMNKKSWRVLIGKKPNLHEEDRLPGDDHTELWVNGAKQTYVSHPYHLTLETMREIVAMCDEHGLECTVDASSWYYPGGTIKLEWTKAEA